MVLSYEVVQYVRRRWILWKSENSRFQVRKIIAVGMNYNIIRFYIRIDEDAVILVYIVEVREDSLFFFF